MIWVFFWTLFSLWSLNSVSSIPTLSRLISSSLEVDSSLGSKTWHFFFLTVAYFHFPHLCWLLFASSLSLLRLWIFPTLLVHYLSYHCTKSAISLVTQCPGLAPFIAGFAGKRYETYRLVTIHGYFLHSGELPGPAVYHRHFLDVMLHCPQWLLQTFSNFLVIIQNFVLTFFSQPFPSSAYDSSASTTTSK